MDDQRPDWQQRLRDLLAGTHTDTGDELDAGAEITITAPDGTETTSALARHFRLEDGDPDQAPVLWLRPITGRIDTPAGLAPAFQLDLARRRGLTLRQARLDDDGEVVLELADGGTARVRPAGPPAMAELADWDTFVFAGLDAATRADLTALEADTFGR